MKSTGVAVTPDPTIDGDSAAQSAFAVAAQVGERLGLRPYANADLHKEFPTCFERVIAKDRTRLERHIVLCGKTKDREVHFLLYETTVTAFTPHADSVRGALLDGLRGHFGDHSVRECEFRGDSDPRRSGCRTLTSRQ